MMPSSGQSISWFGDFETHRDVGSPRAGWLGFANVYLPFVMQSNTGVRLRLGWLHQNHPSIFNLTSFKPKGWDEARLAADDYLRYGIRIVQPVLFPDDGWLTIPAYVRALYISAGADRIQRVSDASEHYASISLGAGVKWRLWHHFNLDLSYSLSWRPGPGDWVGTWDTVQEN